MKTPSAADRAAAERILREMPDPDPVMSPADFNAMVTQAQLQSYLKQLDAGMLSVTGLQDLLADPAPVQLVSGRRSGKALVQNMANMVAALKREGVVKPYAIIHPSALTDV